MSLNMLQKRIYEIYSHHDKRRGIQKTFKWFLSEVYELEEAIMDKDINGIKTEISDVLAWLLSIANLLEINLAEVFIERYGERCPKCGSNPCKCPYREEPDKSVLLKII